MTLPQPKAWEYVGWSRTMWFRAKAANLLPPPILVLGKQYWRTRDLDRLIESMKPARRR